MYSICFYYCIDTAGKKSLNVQIIIQQGRRYLEKEKGFILKYTFKRYFASPICYRCASDTTIQNKRRKPRSVQSSKMSREYLQDDEALRLGVGWRGARSCSPHSLNEFRRRVVGKLGPERACVPPCVCVRAWEFLQHSP